MPPSADAIIPSDAGEGEALRRAREAFARLAGTAKPVILFVTHARGGGVARHVHDLASLIAGEAAVLVLKGHLRSFVALEGQAEHADARLWFHREDGWPALVDLLRSIGVARVHFHHVQALPMRVLDLGRELGCPWDLTLHDYYPICPQYQLADASGRYCGEPDEEGCGRCLAARPAQWPVGIAGWRTAFDAMLRDAARVIAPSRDTGSRISRHFPGIVPLVWPHWDGTTSAPRWMKVLVLGGLSPAKGMGLVEACVSDARNRLLPLRFRVIGYLSHPLGEGSDMRISMTGEYAEGTLASRIEQERGDAILFPAQWPETYSYTLTEAIGSGLPIVASDLGAFAERLQERTRTRIVPWNASAMQINDALMALVPMPGDPAPAVDYGTAPYTYRDRYLEGVTATKQLHADATIPDSALATTPVEAMPQPTLVELFDDAVQCGNGSSRSLLQERVALAEGELAVLVSLRGRLAASEAELERATREVGTVRSELNAARMEAERLSLEAAAWAERVRQLESSSSWRVTAPLRALARWLRR